MPDSDIDCLPENSLVTNTELYVVLMYLYNHQAWLTIQYDCLSMYMHDGVASMRAVCCIILLIVYNLPGTCEVTCICTTALLVWSVSCCKMIMYTLFYAFYYLLVYGWQQFVLLAFFMI